jgi:hypothetical protein
MIICHQTIDLMATCFLDVVSKKEEIIDLVSDVDEVPQVAATYDSKGKARAPNLGDIIELSD